MRTFDPFEISYHSGQIAENLAAQAGMTLLPGSVRSEMKRCCLTSEKLTFSFARTFIIRTLIERDDAGMKVTLGIIRSYLFSFFCTF